MTLTAPAPSGGVQVSLVSGSPSVSVPSTVVVASGNTVQAFSIDVAATATPITATMTATYSGVARTAALTIGQLALSIGLASIPGGLSIPASFRCRRRRRMAERQSR